MADYTMWYRVGTVALTKNSKVVTGTGTYWLSASINPGDLFSVDSVTEYEIQSVNSNTQITLKTAYTGATTTETDYRIVRNFTATMAAQVAANTAQLLNDLRRYVDTDMKSIHGKSAYQIACEKGYTGTESQWVESLKGATAYDVAVRNGYTGTEAQWLETLKAAGEWSTLDERTSILGNQNAGVKNSIYSGKSLGAFTPAHLAAIRAGTFDGMGLGDYFTFSGDSTRYVIYGFNYIYDAHTNKFNSIILMPSSTINCKYNQETTYTSGTEGEDDYISISPKAPYAQSYWYLVGRPAFIEKMKGYFGDDALKPFKINVPAGYDKEDFGNVNAWVTPNSEAHLPTIGMMTGHNFAGMTYDRATSQTMNYMYGKLPLVALMPNMSIGGVFAEPSGQWYGKISAWLMNGTCVNSYHIYASFVRPIFLVG